MSTLVWSPFHPRYLTALSVFDCSDRSGTAREWEREVNLWIRNQTEEGVLHDINNLDADVWIYSNENNRIVGYGSLAPGLWGSVRGVDDERIPVNLLFMVGLDSYYQSKPQTDNKLHRYSYQIIRDLMAKALKRKHHSTLLGLFVHPENEKARNWYKEKLGFRYLDGHSEYSETYKVHYPAMWLDMRRIKKSLKIEELAECPARTRLLPPSDAE